MLRHFWRIWFVLPLWSDWTLRIDFWAFTNPTGHSVCFFFCDRQQHLLTALCCFNVSIIECFVLTGWGHVWVKRIWWTTHAQTSNPKKLQICIIQFISHIRQRKVVFFPLCIQKGLNSTAKFIAVNHSYCGACSSCLILFDVSWKT